MGLILWILCISLLLTLVLADQRAAAAGGDGVEIYISDFCDQKLWWSDEERN
jgi:hypothetical protein